MPQLWLTYQELAEEGFQRDAITARQAAIDAGLIRKRSRDGLSRVLLSEDLMTVYLLNASARYMKFFANVDMAADRFGSFARQPAKSI